MNEECGNFVLLPLLSTLYYGTISYGMVRGNVRKQGCRRQMILSTSKDRMKSAVSVAASRQIWFVQHRSFPPN